MASVDPAATRERRRRLAKRAVIFGALPSLVFAAAAWALRLLPTLHALPRQDRAYGWFHDLLARYAANVSDALAVLFALLCIGLLVVALRTPKPG